MEFGLIFGAGMLLSGIRILITPDTDGRAQLGSTVACKAFVWLLGGLGPPKSQRDAFFRAAPISGLVLPLYPAPVEVQVHQLGDDVELVDELLGMPQKGRVVYCAA
jgi:hypothetical protein